MNKGEMLGRQGSVLPGESSEPPFLEIVGRTLLLSRRSSSLFIYVYTHVRYHTVILGPYNFRHVTPTTPN